MKRVAAAVALLAFLFGFPLNGIACKCADRSPDLLYEEADAVFRGKVVDLKEDSTIGAVEVTEIWKGTNKSAVYVYTDQSSCGFHFKVNKEYVFYADKDKGNYLITACSGTFPMDVKVEEERSLGKGIPPSQQVTLEELDEGVTVKKWGMVGLVGIVLVFFVILLIRIEKRVKKS
ncbi:hypothetical protein [Bacillus sp. Marseille-Q1617]|uniref:hypothetical protein n=1 Tax=Bacillus sp. Marseille-Q1617 TaxID=2736887 RepID=UPI00158DC036|nr:hypothetical protein [Bacillus sp. Marseille-Q1617]